MPVSPSLTSADLDALGVSSFTAGEAPAVVAQLIAAVAEDRIADPADTGYALLLAAEISERQGDLAGATHLTEQAAELARGSADGGWAQAIRARLLSRSGRDDEALAAFEALRPQLTRDPGVAAYLSEIMAECGHGELAERWLTAALATVLDERKDTRGRAEELKVELAYALLQARHARRRDLDLPQDPYDDLADRMRATASPAPVFFWPEPEFDRLPSLLPSLAGTTWDAHRTALESSLVAAATPAAELVRASADDLLAYATRLGADPADPDVLAGYAATMAGTIPWPPERNDPCWCESGAKYKKCCLPRSRP